MKPARKVLVIDDEKKIRDFLSELVGGMGYAVSTACDGEEAIDKIKHDSFDLIITDIRMPGIDGLGVLAYVRENRSGIKVIISSGDREFSSACMKAGADDFILKPFDIRRMTSSVSSLLNESAASL